MQSCSYDLICILTLRSSIHKIAVMPKARRVSQRLASQRAKQVGRPSVRLRDQGGGAKGLHRASSPVPVPSSDKSKDLESGFKCTPIVTSTLKSSITSASSAIVQEFQALCNKSVSENNELYTKYAKQIKKYMRNQFDFFGLKAPQRRKLQKEVVDKNTEILKDRAVLFSVLEQLWKESERDFQAFGVDLCQQFRQEMLGSTDDHFRQAVSYVQACITNKSWWDTVDYLAYQVMGYFVKERPTLGVPLMDQWIKHDNMWLRRVAILHQLDWKEDTDETRLFTLCLSRAHEKDFFIRKAIGWALRQYSKTNGPAVRDFVEESRDSLSGLSIREALKYC